MLKKLILLSFFVIACAQEIRAWDFVDKAGDTLSLELCQEQDLPACEVIFIDAFLKAYADFSVEELGINDKFLFLREAFADVYDDLKQGFQKLIVAKKEGRVIGFAGFKPTENPNQIYISQLAVDPDQWQLGIGTHLVYSVFNLYDNVESLVVIPRRINNTARFFYTNLGFIQSPYMHPGYNPEKYVGYEWSKP